MWDMLKEKFDNNNSPAGQLEVRRSFNQSSVQSGQTIENYVALLLRYRKTLAGTNNAISDETFKAHLLSTLPKDYDNYVDILMELQHQHTIDSLVQRLLEREKTLQSRQGGNLSASAAGSALTARYLRNQQSLNPSAALVSRVSSTVRRRRGRYPGRVGINRRQWKAQRGLVHRHSSSGRWTGREMVCWHCSKEGHR